MAIRYECHYCNGVFPAEDIIEGRDRGHREGFLCPHCGKNIKDDFFLAEQRLNECQKKWLNRLAWLVVPFFLSTIFDREITLMGHTTSLSLVLLIAFLIAACLILVFVPCTRKSAVFVTKPVD